MSGIVILGTGLAGYNLAREIRKRDKDVELILITQDDGAFYSKPMLSNALAKKKLPDDLPMADVEKMRADLNAAVMTDTTVTAIDADNKTLSLQNETINYDKLVLAVGASPIQLPIKGDAADDIVVVNNLVDYREFRQRLEGKQSVAIIGPGLIGCEFANDLVQAGYRADVIGPDETPLGRLLPTQIGLAAQQALKEAGVNWHLQTVVDEVNRQPSGYQLSLQNGEQLQADVVLSAIGLRANKQLAESVGIKCNRGILVNRQLETSHADIYALGDCAEVSGHFLPFVLPIMQCVRALAATLCGEPTDVSYPAMPVLVKTPSYPLIVSPPHRDAQGAWEITQVGQGLKGLFMHEGNLLGMALGGEAVSEKQALSKQLPPVLQ